MLLVTDRVIHSWFLLDHNKLHTDPQGLNTSTSRGRIESGLSLLSWLFPYFSFDPEPGGVNTFAKSKMYDGQSTLMSLEDIISPPEYIPLVVEGASRSALLPIAG